VRLAVDWVSRQVVTNDSKSADSVVVFDHLLLMPPAAGCLRHRLAA
jgi:hypothetical protein